MNHNGERKSIRILDLAHVVAFINAFISIFHLFFRSNYKKHYSHISKADFIFYFKAWPQFVLTILAIYFIAECIRKNDGDNIQNNHTLQTKLICGLFYFGILATFIFSTWTFFVLYIFYFPSSSTLSMNDFN